MSKILELVNPENYELADIYAETPEELELKFKEFIIDNWGMEEDEIEDLKLKDIIKWRGKGVYDYAGADFGFDRIELVSEAERWERNSIINEDESGKLYLDEMAKGIKSCEEAFDLYFEQWIEEKIVADTLRLIDRIKLPNIKNELKRLGVKGYSKLNLEQSIDLIREVLKDNPEETLDIYYTYKLELDMFQKEVLEALNITKSKLNKLDLKVTGNQNVYIHTSHYFAKYDRESVYRLLRD